MFLNVTQYFFACKQTEHSKLTLCHFTALVKTIMHCHIPAFRHRTVTHYVTVHMTPLTLQPLLFSLFTVIQKSYKNTPTLHSMEEFDQYQKKSALA